MQSYDIKERHRSRVISIVSVAIKLPPFIVLMTVSMTLSTTFKILDLGDSYYKSETQQDYGLYLHGFAVLHVGLLIIKWIFRFVLRKLGIFEGSKRIGCTSFAFGFWILFIVFEYLFLLYWNTVAWRVYFWRNNDYIRKTKIAIILKYYCIAGTMRLLLEPVTKKDISSL